MCIYSPFTLPRLRLIPTPSHALLLPWFPWFGTPCLPPPYATQVPRSPPPIPSSTPPHSSCISYTLFLPYLSFWGIYPHQRCDPSTSLRDVRLWRHLPLLASAPSPATLSLRQPPPHPPDTFPHSFSSIPVTVEFHPLTNFVGGWHTKY